MSGRTEEERWAAVEEPIELLHEEDIDGAVKALREVLLADPGNAHAHYYLGLAFMRKEKAGAALAAFAEAIDRDPGHLGAQVYRGWCLYELARFEEAIDAGERALEISADDGDALHLLGLSYAETGRNVEAMMCLERFLKGRPSAEDRMDAEALLITLRGGATVMPEA
ncbi:MAG: tetratricopeptide repeat protein [Deltaproteobacteria bacterium]|jgi:tetratricopeptide (TPR) repeat protein|nr:tetratricopeptide repeat protein [Deltaproteobacteria bacterium]MBK8691742.1 tetratricopeptide repeat protein [Deltaproteobacteria bacterium]MBP6832020.1 tetratricopeptide repeat protein [Deltaproteobacteria bacterium]